MPSGGSRARSREPFTVVDATIAQMRQALDEGRVTSRGLVEQSLQRIALYDHQLHAAISVNPRALAEADARDRERASGIARGPLHGIPVALKDNIHTTDMPTTGGALAFAGFFPPYDATLTGHLRDAGAIIIAKTQLTELANWVTVGMPTNYNSLNGYGFNPYDPRRDPRDDADGRPLLATGGSSSGAGTAVSMWAANVGTETSGSILSPANANMLVGIKPTVGRVSRYGVIPITADQDTPGPMARTVADAALLLGVLEGRGADPHDPATLRCPRPADGSYLSSLSPSALAGARIGIPRAFYYEVGTPASVAASGGLLQSELRVMEAAIAVLRQAGATIVDPADIPSIVDTIPENNLRRRDICAGTSNGRGRDAECSVVLKYGMKRDFTQWLATLGPAAPVTTLAGLRAWNLAHRSAGALKYEQQNLDISDEMDVAGDRARYDADRRKDVFLTGAHGIDEVMAGLQLDALLFPGADGADVAARPGYPTVIVPFARVTQEAVRPLPAGVVPPEVPMGISFTGTACSEPRLIGLAYAFEQATKRRVPPPAFP